MLLTRDNMNISRTVCRKPVKLNTVIPFNISVSFCYRIAMFNLFVKRAFLICSDIHFTKELNLIRNIATDNGFPIKYISSNIQ